MMTYLDYNATAPLLPVVRERMSELMATPGNSSSSHSFGREAKKFLEDARTSLAATISAFPNEIIFTASATEANNWAINAFPNLHVLVSAVEHASVLKQSSTHIPVDADGLVNLVALDEMLAQGPALVSVMLVNNETGSIQPIAEIAALCEQHNSLLHCDAVQVIGRMPLDFSSLGVDLLTISGHKCGGPVGAGALVVKTGLEVPPMLRGGAQEMGRRAGTSNVPAIVGFAISAEQAKLPQELPRWREEMESTLAGYGARIYGSGAPRIGNTTCVSMPGVTSDVQLMHFDLEGIAISAGSACASGKVESSHVLRAMGVPEAEAVCAIRVSGGWGSTAQDYARFTAAWLKLAERISKQRKAS